MPTCMSASERATEGIQTRKKEKEKHNNKRRNEQKKEGREKSGKRELDSIPGSKFCTFVST